MTEKKENEKASEPKESELKSSPQQFASEQHLPSREDRLGLWVDDPKLQ